MYIKLICDCQSSKIILCCSKSRSKRTELSLASTMEIHNALSLGLSGFDPVSHMQIPMETIARETGVESKGESLNA
jgi:hypothetical protein